MIVTVSVAPRTWGAGEPWVEIEVPVRFTQKVKGLSTLGYYVERADTGQHLGMASKTTRISRA